MKHGFEARQLLRAAREGVLATSGGDGAGADGPHAALVTPATTPGLDILLLLSGLSRHTRGLASDPRCALLVAGPGQGPNPQARPRLTITCTARRLEPGPEERRARDRYLAIHPYAGLYASLDDFRLWSLTPLDSLLVAGFGRAIRINAADLVPKPALEQDAAALVRAAAMLPGGTVVACDGDGIDLAEAEATRRHTFRRPIADLAEMTPDLLEAGTRG